MLHKSFIYYGYDKETYLDCKEMIRSYNRKNALIMNGWFLVVNLLYLAFSSFNMFGVSIEQTPFYALYTVLAIAYALVMMFFPKQTETHSTLFVYILMAGMFTYGVFTSIMRPYMPASMYLVMYMLINLLFIGNVVRMIVLAFLSTTIMLISSFALKTFSIAYQDLYNTLMVALLSGGLHYMFQKSRISQFVMYQKDLQIQRELEIKSSFDALTGLLNRGRFFSIAEKALTVKADGEYISLCLLDLDGFKQINDRLGHQMGDKVIQIAGQIITETIDEAGIFKTNRITSTWDLTAPQSLAGRLGGDEFIIFMRGKKTRAQTLSVLQKMLDKMNAVRFDSLEGIHASFGITEMSDGESDMDGAYSRADAALYESKRAGKNRICFFEEMGDKV